jgi:hypothetical protein
VKLVVVLPELLFPEASEKKPLRTNARPEPLDLSAVGVNTTEYDVPEPEKDDNVPPLNVMSPTAKSVEASDNAIVRVDVSPDFSVVALAVMVTVGANVS